jgi:hypothetical protein
VQHEATYAQGLSEMPSNVSPESQLEVVFTSDVALLLITVPLSCALLRLFALALIVEDTQ